MQKLENVLTLKTYLFICFHFWGERVGGRGQLAPFPVATFQPLTTLAAKRTT